jgi:hypothetical protein
MLDERGGHAEIGCPLGRTRHVLTDASSRVVGRKDESNELARSLPGEVLDGVLYAGVGVLVAEGAHVTARKTEIQLLLDPCHLLGGVPREG